MRAKEDPLGKALLDTGSLTESMLADVLEQQRRGLAIGSMCYILGHVDEDTLARALSRQFGMPSVVLERCIVPLHVLSAVPEDVARRQNILPLYEDEQRLFVAAEDPQKVTDVLREIRFVRGKMPVVHVALQVTLARAIRACYAARNLGQRTHVGRLADNNALDEGGYMFVISEAETTSHQALSSPEAEAVVEDVTKELGHLELDAIQQLDDEFSRTVETSALSEADAAQTLQGFAAMQTEAGTRTKEQVRILAKDTIRLPTVTRANDLLDDVPAPLPEVPLPEPVGAMVHAATVVPDVDVSRQPARPVIDLDAGTGTGFRQNRDRHLVLIVDDDFATRHLLVKVLKPLGIQTATAATGGEAIRLLKANPPEVVIIDVMLPEMDGFQICQAIKQSEKYRHIGVLLMSAVISSKRVTADILARYGAEGYYEKPIDTDVIASRVQELLRAARGETSAAADDSFDRAIALYKGGDVDGAIKVLRSGLEVDPLSPKHHFVLANLLQKKALIYEAIEEYEATVELKPDYFPALTRLAYLYYKKGFSAKAAQVWERSLLYCTDNALRKNIDEFIATLRAEMQTENG